MCRVPLVTEVLRQPRLAEEGCEDPGTGALGWACPQCRSSLPPAWASASPPQCVFWGLWAADQWDTATCQVSPFGLPGGAPSHVCSLLQVSGRRLVSWGPRRGWSCLLGVLWVCKCPGPYSCPRGPASSLCCVSLSSLSLTLEGGKQAHKSCLNL